MTEALLERIQNESVTMPNAGMLIRNPEAVRVALGANFQYSQPIEAEVAESFELVKVFWRSMGETDAAFFEEWLKQEAGHAVTQASILDRLNLEPMPTVHKANPLVRAAGILVNATPGLADVAQTGILAYMAPGELEAATAYRAEAAILTKLDEQDLARVMGKTARQESWHQEWQSTEAHARYERLSPWQKRFVRKFITYYRPVGVRRGDTERMSGFGNMLLTVTDDNGVELANLLQALATELVEVSPSSTFVAKRYKECIDQLTTTDDVY